MEVEGKKRENAAIKTLSQEKNSHKIRNKSSSEVESSSIDVIAK